LVKHENKNTSPAIQNKDADPTDAEPTKAAVIVPLLPAR